ncbi:MAG: hypothetical protein ACRCYS_08710 [Beijerinckiaceae bacterium]
MATTILTAIALCGLLWTCWLRSHDKGVIAKHEAKVTEAIATASASASASASEVVSETKAGIEAGNDAARKAASGSADPLKAALDKLHANPKQER